jgi:hypothetical protein
MANPAQEVANLIKLLNTPNLSALPVRVVIQGQIQVEAQGPTPIERVVVVLTPGVPQDILQFAPQSWWLSSQSLFSAARNAWLVVDTSQPLPPPPPAPPPPPQYIPQPPGAQIGDILVYNGSGWVLLNVGNAGEVITSNGPGFMPSYQPGGGGGGGTANIATYTCLASVAVGDVVYVSGSGTVSKASSSFSFPALGVVQAKPTATSADVVLSGQTLAVMVGLVAGSEYFTSSTPGALSSLPPTSPGSTVQRIGIAESPTQLVVQIGPAFTI